MRAKVQIHSPIEDSEFHGLHGRRGIAKGLFEDHRKDSWVVVELGYMNDWDGDFVTVVPFEVIYWLSGLCKVTAAENG
jgi:hypothetical protein